jgi:hypothetical protein
MARTERFRDDPSTSGTSMSNFLQLNTYGGGSITKATSLFVGSGLGGNTAAVRHAGAEAISVNQYAELDLTGLAFNGTSRRNGIILRSSVDQDESENNARDYYEFYIIDDSASTRSWEFREVVNGVEGAALASGNTSVGNGGKISGEAIDDVIKLYFTTSGGARTKVYEGTHTTFATGKPGLLLSTDQRGGVLSLGDAANDPPADGTTVVSYH